MEKRTPHCQLSIVKELIQAGKVRSTFSALTGGAALGFDFDGMVAVVLALTPKDFYKSMTTYADHKVWQDVYRPTTEAGEVYLKLTVIEDVLIVSFKEL
ncbi:MAG: type II toxin-antitoxin system MqsR family toxin [Acidobacteriaceae bacterium]